MNLGVFQELPDGTNRKFWWAPIRISKNAYKRKKDDINKALNSNSADISALLQKNFEHFSNTDLSSTRPPTGSFTEKNSIMLSKSAYDKKILIALKINLCFFLSF